MPVQNDIIKKVGTYGEQVTGYEMDGVHYIRAMSSLTAETVQKSPRFAKTRAYAANFRLAAKLAVRTFRTLHITWRIEEVRSKLTSMAIDLVHAGTDPEDIPEVLEQFLATCGYSPDITFDIIPDSDKAELKRIHKVLKAARRKARREEKKQAALMAALPATKTVPKKKLRIAKTYLRSVTAFRNEPLNNYKPRKLKDPKQHKIKARAPV